MDFESWQEFPSNQLDRAQFSKSNIPYSKRVNLLCKIVVWEGLNTRPFGKAWCHPIRIHPYAKAWTVKAHDESEAERIDNFQKACINTVRCTRAGGDVTRTFLFFSTVDLSS